MMVMLEEQVIVLWLCTAGLALGILSQQLSQQKKRDDDSARRLTELPNMETDSEREQLRTVPDLQTLRHVIVLVHFILSVWATMGGSWLPTPYFYVHIALFVCGLWAIASSDSIDAIMMMLMVLAFSILQDIILLSLYEPRGYNLHERAASALPQSLLNEYRFALGMCILNLILKPFTGFLLLRICQARSNDTAFNIPGIDRIPGLGGMGGGRGYEDIDNRQTSGPYSSVPVESAEAHSTVDKE